MVNLGDGYARGGDAQGMGIDPDYGNLTVLGDTLVSIEALEGSAFDDQLLGDDGDNTLVGGAGADGLYGNGGFDWTSYATSGSGVVFTAVDDWEFYGVRGAGGDAEGDVLSGIEGIVGSEYDDFIEGMAADEHFVGGGGNDTLVGGAGADSLDGGVGTDLVSYASSSVGVVVNLGSGTASGGDAEGDSLVSIEVLEGSAYDDSLTGGAAAETLIGGGGADTLDGGAGADRASYASSMAAVTVDLAAGVGHGGDAEGDTLVSIEAVEGSAFADRLTGSADADTLIGGAGDDTLGGDGRSQRWDRQRRRGRG